MVEQPSSPPANEVTILTVSFNSGPYLTLNHAWTRRLNPTVDVRWIVAENGSPETPEELGTLSGVTVLPGVPNTFRGPTGPSFHHGLALNQLLRHVATRFVVILDPDFYLVRPSWVTDVLGHMDRVGLSFFGVPWHPKWYAKYRYFPCVHCMIIDLARVDLRELDCLPDLPEDLHRVPNGREKVRKRGRLSRVADLWSFWADHARILSFSDVASRSDTGSRIFQRFGRDSEHRAECATPVFEVNRDYIGPAGAKLFPFRKLIPDRWNFVPARADSFVSGGFSSSGCVGVAERGWEEFMWRSEPFGFHLRGHRRESRGEKEISDVQEILRNVAGHWGLEPAPSTAGALDLV